MKKSEGVLFAAVLVDMLGFGIVMPVLPFYATKLSATPLEVTVIIASFSATQLAAAPLWGRVSDRRGRRPLIIAGLFASAVSYLIFGLAQSVAVLLLSRIAAGAAGGTISVAQAYIADTTTAERRAHGLGLLGAASAGEMSREMFGPDVKASITTAELRELVEGVRDIESMLANPIDKESAAHDGEELRRIFTKSLYAGSFIAEGTVLHQDHFQLKKPGVGLPASHLPTIIGKRLRRDLLPGQLISLSDVEA